MEINKCPSCGANVKHGSVMCEYCGNSFKTEEKPKENKLSEVPNTKLQTLASQTSLEIKEHVNSLAKAFKNVSWAAVVLCWVFVWPLGFILLMGKLMTSNKEK